MAEESFHDPLADLLEHRNWGRCLDLASGRGAFLHRLAELGRADCWLALDLDAQQLREPRSEAGRTQVSLAGAPLLALQARGERTPLATGVLDTVACSFSLHHVPAPGRLLAEACRLLKPGGRLVLAEPVADGLRPRQTLHRDLHHLAARLDRRLGRYHRPTYRLRELRALLQSQPLHWHEVAWRPADQLPGAEGLASVLDTLERLDAELVRRRWADLRLGLREIRRRVEREGYGSQTQFLAVGVK